MTINHWHMYTFHTKHESNTHVKGYRFVSDANMMRRLLSKVAGNIGTATVVGISDSSGVQLLTFRELVTTFRGFDFLDC